METAYLIINSVCAVWVASACEKRIGEEVHISIAKADQSSGGRAESRFGWKTDEYGRRVTGFGVWREGIATTGWWGS